MNRNIARNRNVAAALGLCTGLLALVAVAADHDDPPPQTLARAAVGSSSIKPLTWWSGPASEVRKPDYAVARSEGEWLELWTRHSGKPAPRNHIGQVMDAPIVDFEQCMVVAIFKGDSWNSNGVFIASVVEDGDVLRVRFDERTYQTAGPNGGGVKVRPYGLFILPRIEKTVVIEENVQNLKNHPEKWRERGRIKAASAK